MKSVMPIALSLFILILLTGCNPTKQNVGTVVGAGSGAFIGSQIGGGTGQLAAVAIGTLLGGYIGGSIGKNMDELDQYKTQQTLESSPTGSTVAWNNPDTNVDYRVTPTSTYEDASGPCREYTTEAVIEGQVEIVHGTACRGDGGSWHATN